MTLAYAHHIIYMDYRDAQEVCAASGGLTRVIQVGPKQWAIVPA